MSISQVRRILRAHFGDRQYRIVGLRAPHRAEIHVFGDMPNSQDEGWYLFGYVDDPATEMRIEQLA